MTLTKMMYEQSESLKGDAGAGQRPARRGPRRRDLDFLPSLRGSSTRPDYAIWPSPSSRPLLRPLSAALALQRRLPALVQVNLRVLLLLPSVSTLQLPLQTRSTLVHPLQLPLPPLPPSPSVRHKHQHPLHLSLARHLHQRAMHSAPLQQEASALAHQLSRRPLQLPASPLAPRRRPPMRPLPTSLALLSPPTTLLALLSPPITLSALLR